MVQQAIFSSNSALYNTNVVQVEVYIVQARNQDFSQGGAYLNNQDQKMNFQIIGHSSVEDTMLLGESGAMLPARKNFEM